MTLVAPKADNGRLTLTLRKTQIRSYLELDEKPS